MEFGLFGIIAVVAIFYFLGWRADEEQERNNRIARANNRAVQKEREEWEGRQWEAQNPALAAALKEAATKHQPPYGANEMTTIILDYSLPAVSAARVRKLLDRVAAQDPNWNGATFHIRHGDHTHIQTTNEIAGAALLNDINNLLNEVPVKPPRKRA